MSNNYLDKLVEYMSTQAQKRFNVRNINYGSLHNLTNSENVFSYQVYRNKEGVSYSANIYYWYYLLLTLLWITVD